MGGDDRIAQTKIGTHVGAGGKEAADSGPEFSILYEGAFGKDIEFRAEAVAFCPDVKTAHSHRVDEVIRGLLEGNAVIGVRLLNKGLDESFGCIVVPSFSDGCGYIPIFEGGEAFNCEEEIRTGRIQGGHMEGNVD